jgi:hypothetical protein
MDWDYRVIKQNDGHLKVHQVFYQADGSIYGMSEDEIVLEGFEMDEIVSEWKAMKLAFEKPVIELGNKKKGTQMIKRDPEPVIEKVTVNYLPDMFRTITASDET